MMISHWISPHIYESNRLCAASINPHGGETFPPTKSARSLIRKQQDALLTWLRCSTGGRRNKKPVRLTFNATAAVSQWMAGSHVTAFSPGVIKSWVKALDTGPAKHVLKCRGHSARGIYGLQSISSDLKRLWLTAERVEMGFRTAVGKHWQGHTTQKLFTRPVNKGTRSLTHTHCFCVWWNIVAYVSFKRK